MKCKSCGANISFVPTPAGRKMPCDAGCVYYAEDAAGKESFVRNDGVAIKGRVVAKPEEATCLAYRPHWMNCPGADKHRRKQPTVKQQSMFKTEEENA